VAAPSWLFHPKNPKSKLLIGKRNQTILLENVLYSNDVVAMVGREMCIWVEKWRRSKHRMTTIAVVRGSELQPVCAILQ